ncbi:MAG: hypothetical protein SGJ20_05795 [Planctomycetota bacterium]|nr:hypothetical protein [Planctomycetota bacterium]
MTKFNPYAVIKAGKWMQMEEQASLQKCLDSDIDEDLKVVLLAICTAITEIKEIPVLRMT